MGRFINFPKTSKYVFDFSNFPKNKKWQTWGADSIRFDDSIHFDDSNQLDTSIKFANSEQRTARVAGHASTGRVAS